MSKSIITILTLFILWISVKAAEIHLVVDPTAASDNSLVISTIINNVTDLRGVDLRFLYDKTQIHIDELIPKTINNFDWYRFQLSDNDIAATGFNFKESIPLSSGDTLVTLLCTLNDTSTVVSLKNNYPILVNNQNNELPCTVYPAIIDVNTAIESSNSVLNKDFSLTNFPNPFNPYTHLIINNPEHRQNGSIKIFNVNGQLVWEKSLLFESGVNEIVWNGTDANVQSVPSGVYFYRVELLNKLLNGKCILIR